jgi:uncharacterized membrane protein
VVLTVGQASGRRGFSVTASGGQDNDTGRIEAFSDGVFAIAITLLIIEIGVPHVVGTESLSERLVKLWPSYLGYAISFLVIGTIWANHHNRFRLISRSDHILLFLNIVFLMCVAFIPFPTALSGTDEHRTTTVAVYSGTLAVTAIFFTTLWLYAAGNYRLVDRAVDPLLLRAMTRRYVLGLLLYILAFALAFFSAVASLALIVILALIFVLPEPEGPGSSRRTPRRPPIRG